MAGCGGGVATPLLSRHGRQRWLPAPPAALVGQASGSLYYLGRSRSSVPRVVRVRPSRLRLGVRENRQERQIEVVRFADVLLLQEARLRERVQLAGRLKTRHAEVLLDGFDLRVGMREDILAFPRILDCGCSPRSFLRRTQTRRTPIVRVQLRAGRAKLGDFARAISRRHKASRVTSHAE